MKKRKERKKNYTRARVKVMNWLSALPSSEKARIITKRGYLRLLPSVHFEAKKEQEEATNKKNNEEKITVSDFYVNKYWAVLLTFLIKPLVVLLWHSVLSYFCCSVIFPHPYKQHCDYPTNGTKQHAQQPNYI